MMFRDELCRLIDAIPPDRFEDALGDLEAAKARLYRRLSNQPASTDSLRCYTANQVAELLTRDVSWVRRHQADLGAIKHDGAVLYPEAGLRRFLGLDR